MAWLYGFTVSTLLRIEIGVPGPTAAVNVTVFEEETANVEMRKETLVAPAATGTKLGSVAVDGSEEAREM